MAVGTKTTGARMPKGTTACSNRERETAKKTYKKEQPKGAKSIIGFLIFVTLHPPKNWCCNCFLTNKKEQPKGAKTIKSKNNGKHPNGGFFFIVVTAEGKVERTWNAGRNNKEKSSSETDLVPVFPFNTKILLKCLLFYIIS